MDDLPAWAPSLSDVAVYVTSRTVTATDEDGAVSDTFTDDTFPTSTQVDGMLWNVCAWITAQVSDVPDDLHELAETVASLRTAGLIQLSFPVRDGDVPTGTELLKQADKALETLLSAAGSAATPTDALSPVGNFPAPCEWGTFGSERRWSW